MKINVWNRQYEYENSFFPKSIKIGGEEILYAPISLDVYFGTKKGEWHNGAEVPFPNDEEGNQVFAAAAEAENLIVNADIKAEEDGLLKTDFRLMPYWHFCKNREDGVPRLTKAEINISLKKKFATLLHYWPSTDDSICPWGDKINSFAIPGEPVVLAFKPYIWLGNDNAGLGICFESDKNFISDDTESVMTVTDCGEFVNLKINLIDRMPEDWKRAEHWGNNIPIIRYSMGIQATPAKEFDKDHLNNWRVFHTGNLDTTLFGPDGDKYFDKIVKSGAKWLIIHEDWSVIQNYGYPKDEEKVKELSEKCHKNGIKLMSYFGYEVCSLLPGFNEKADEMLNKNANGNTVGGWQRMPIQRDFTVCYNGSYSDVMLERARYAMDELGIDGIYTDGTYVPWGCANENHGCGYRDKEGKLHVTYPIYAVREHCKKLFNMVHERGGVVDAHQSSCCVMPILSYTDYYYDGENIQEKLRKDISHLRLDNFRAEFVGENMGIPCNFIAYTNAEYSLRKIAGLALIHNTYPRPCHNYDDLEFVSNVWNIYDEYDIKSANWVSYYDEKNIFTDDEAHIHVSYYEREGDYLLIMTSLNEGVRNLALDGEFKEIKDYFDAEEFKTENGKTIIPLEPLNVKIIRVVK